MVQIVYDMIVLQWVVCELCTDFQYSNDKSLSSSGIKAHYLWFLKSTIGITRQIENGPQKQVFGSNYYYWTDFRNSNGIYSGSIKVMTENCCRWISTSGLDGKRLFAYNLRTNETNFKIQTAYVKAQLQWLIKISVAKNLLPVLAENGYLLLIQELIDDISEFKR